MATRKEIREMRKALSSVEELVRQKTLQILRNTPNKEQAASMIARQIFNVVRQEIKPIKDAMSRFMDEVALERVEMLKKHEAEFARIEREIKEQDEDGEEWKRGV